MSEEKEHVSIAGKKKLEDKVNSAIIHKVSNKSKSVGYACLVDVTKYTDADQGNNFSFAIVGQIDQNMLIETGGVPINTTFVRPGSPIYAAIENKKVGEKVNVNIPSCNVSYELKIDSIEVISSLKDKQYKNKKK